MSRARLCPHTLWLVMVACHPGDSGSGADASDTDASASSTDVGETSADESAEGEGPGSDDEGDGTDGGSDDGSDDGADHGGNASTPGNILERDLVGQKSLLVLPISFPLDGAAGAALGTSAKALTHGVDVAALLAEQSHGRLDLQVDVTPVLELPQPISFYFSDPELEYVQWHADIVALAAEAGYEVDDYDYELVMTPKFWLNSWNGFAFTRKTAFNSKWSIALSSHELGHTFGWQHARFWRVQGSTDPLDPNGSLVEYGDNFDIMGKNQQIVGRFGAWKQTRAGWLDPESIERVTESGVYTVQSMAVGPDDLAAGTYAALELRIDEVTSYWVLYRGDEPFASDGAIITRTTAITGAGSILYDMTPDSQPPDPMWGQVDWSDARLEVGRTFTDPSAEIAVEVLDVGPDGLEVDITVPDDIATLPRPPIVDVVSPNRHQKVSGDWTFEVTAYDPETAPENGAGISEVTLTVEGAEPVLVETFTEPPYTAELDTAPLPDGMYLLTILAEREDGLQTSAWATTLVDNTGPSF